MPITHSDKWYVAKCAQTATLAINFLHIYKCTNSHLLHIMTNAFKHVKNCSNIGTGPQNIKTTVLHRPNNICDFSLFVYQTCCSRDELLLWKCFFFFKLVVKWALRCQKLAAVGVRWTWSRVGGYWRSLGTNGEDGGHWRSSAAEVGVGRVGSGAHYSGGLPAATSGAPTSPLLKYLKQVLFFIVIGNISPPEIFRASPTLKYLTTNPLLMANIGNKSSPHGKIKYLKQILLSWQIYETNILLLVKSDIWNKSSSHGKYLKKSSPYSEVKYLERNSLLMANIWNKSSPHSEVK